jgi:hypothetical protein
MKEINNEKINLLTPSWISNSIINKKLENINKYRIRFQKYITKETQEIFEEGFNHNFGKF